MKISWSVGPKGDYDSRAIFPLLRQIVEQLKTFNNDSQKLKDRDNINDGRGRGNRENRAEVVDRKQRS